MYTTEATHFDVKFQFHELIYLWSLPRTHFFMNFFYFWSICLRMFLLDMSHSNLQTHTGVLPVVEGLIYVNRKIPGVLYPRLIVVFSWQYGVMVIAIEHEASISRLRRFKSRNPQYIHCTLMFWVYTNMYHMYNWIICIL